MITGFNTYLKNNKYCSYSTREKVLNAFEQSRNHQEEIKESVQPGIADTEKQACPLITLLLIKSLKKNY